MEKCKPWKRLGRKASQCRGSYGRRVQRPTWGSLSALLPITVVSGRGSPTDGVDERRIWCWKDLVMFFLDYVDEWILNACFHVFIVL